MIWGQACWLRLEIPALGRLRRCELEANLGYIMRSVGRTNSQLPLVPCKPLPCGISRFPGKQGLLGPGDLVVKWGDVGVV